MFNASNLKKRLGFVAVAVPLSFVIVGSSFDIAAFLRGIFGISDKVLSAPIYPGQILALIIVMLGAFEYIKLLSASNKRNAFWMGYVYLLIMSLAYLLDYQVSDRHGTISISALLAIVALEAFVMGEPSKGRWKRASLFFCGMIILRNAAICLMDLFREPISTLFAAPVIPVLELGKLDAVAIIAATFMCDSAAYFVGSAWGKRRLSPTISPNKTIEGSVAGLLTSVLVMTVFWVFFRDPKYHILIGVAMGFVIGVSAQIGDLLMSLIKRYFKVKDASDMIPGHGGILDRFDSVFFSAMAIYWFARIVIKVT